jgi:nitrogen fixation NifU-like protein
MQPDGLDALYQEIILDHYRSPRNHGLLSQCNLKAEGYNPFCGDQVVLTGEVDGSGRISSVGFSGQGCAISQASASMMTELLKGRTVEEAAALLAQFKGVMHGEELSEDQKETMGELIALEGVRRFPIRIKCALLAWSALQDAIAEYEGAGGA